MPWFTDVGLGHIKVYCLEHIDECSDEYLLEKLKTLDEYVRPLTRGFSLFNIFAFDARLIMNINASIEVSHLSEKRS